MRILSLVILFLNFPAMAFAQSQQEMILSHRVAAIDSHYYVYCRSNGLSMQNTGFVGACTLSMDTPYALRNPGRNGVQGMACSGGYIARFYPDGQLAQCHVRAWGLNTAGGSRIVCNGVATFQHDGLMVSCD